MQLFRMLPPTSALTRVVMTREAFLVRSSDTPTIDARASA